MSQPPQFQSLVSPPNPKDNPPNPKQRYGDLKPDLSLIPGVASAHEALAFENGAAKYGPYNWREKAVEARTYIAAAKRHMDAWMDGEEYSVDTVEAGRPVHNLGHSLACLAILLDSIENGNLIDNRPPKGKSSEMHERIKRQRSLPEPPPLPWPLDGSDVRAGRPGRRADEILDGWSIPHGGPVRPAY